MFNKPNFKKNGYQLNGKYLKKGYDWWWHNFTAIDELTGDEVPFFIEFFIINPGLNPNEVVLGQTEENKKLGNRPSYLMIKCGCWGKNKIQLHRFIPLNDVNIKKAPIEISTPDCFLNENSIKGHVKVDAIREGEMCDVGEMSFDLNIEKIIPYNVGYGTCSLFRKLKLFEMYWHASGMKSKYRGSVELNGRKYLVNKDKSYGYADKNWGSNFTTPWLWLSSNKCFDHDTKEQLGNTVFDIGGGKPKVLNITFKDKLLGAYYIEGKEYEYNFSKFLHPSKTKFSFEVDEANDICHWYVEQSNRKSKIITKIHCKVSDMLFVNYEAPNGLKQHNKLYNGGTGYGTLEIYNKIKGKMELTKTIDVYNVGCEYGEFC